MSKRWYVYLDGEKGVIRVPAVRKPYMINLKSDLWNHEEFNGHGWEIPAPPHIAWNNLKTLQYVGSVPK